MKIIIINAMWCPGCLISKSIWNEIKLMYPNMEYINYDYDLDEENIIKYNISILLIEHDMKLVMNICDRLTVLDYGRIIAEGKPNDIKKNPKVIETAKVEFCS